MPETTDRHPGTSLTAHEIHLEARQETSRSLSWLARASLLEGSTLLALLLIAVPLKHLAGFPQATAIMGPVHGLAFMFYIWMLTQTLSAGLWSKAEGLRLTLAAFLPFGAFFNAPLIRRAQTRHAQ